MINGVHYLICESVTLFIIITTWLIDIFNSLLLLSLSLALSSKLPSLFIGSLLASASDSDSESNDLKCLIEDC